MIMSLTSETGGGGAPIILCEKHNYYYINGAYSYEVVVSQA